MQKIMKSDGRTKPRQATELCGKNIKQWLEFAGYIVLFSALYCFTLPLNAEAQQAKENQQQKSSPPDAMLILDGSGSMWGKIKDGHKIMISRAAIATATRPFEDKINLGLISYGHRRRGACLDIQTLQHPAPLNPVQFSRLVNQIKPLGKTPITSSLEEASKNLGNSGRGGSIILLADGPENCQKNPCQLITPEFAKANNIIVHVIAFSMEKKDEQSLQCLTKNTGGLFSSPQDQEQLIKALDASLTASLNGLSLKPTPEIAVKKKLKPELSLTAHLGPESEAISAGIEWNIIKLAENNEPDAELPPWKSKEKKPKFELTPGTYRITADFDEYQITREATLAKGQQLSEKFVFNLSQLKLPASWSPPDSRSGFGKLLLEAQPEDGQNNKEPDENTASSNISIIKLTDKPQTTLIPSGAYKVIGIDNGKMQNWFIHAKPGNAVTLPIWTKTGRIRFQLLDSERGAPLEKPFTRIYSTKLRKDTLVEVARSTAMTPQFDLEAGSYLAHIVNSHANARYSFTINAGEETRETIHLQQGDLSIILDEKINKETAALEITRLTTNKNSTENEQISEYVTDFSDFRDNKNLKLSLNQGTYRLILRTAPTARAIIKDVTLKTGDIKTVRFAAEQSKVSFTISNRSDALSRHQIFWQLYDNNGRMIWQSTESEPSLLLSSGRYKIAAEIGDDKYQTAIRLRGSKPRSFDLSAKKLK